MDATLPAKEPVYKPPKMLLSLNTESRQYICESCPNIYKDRSGLWRHVKKCHNGNKTTATATEEKNAETNITLYDLKNGKTQTQSKNANAINRKMPEQGVGEALATQSVGVRGFACEADVSGRRLGTPTGLSGNGLPSKDNRVAEELHLGNRENVRTKFTRKCSLKCQKEFSIGNSRRVGLVRHLTHSLSHTCILHILRQIEHMIRRERMFSVFQMSKVLAYHSLKYTDLCSTSTLDNSPKYTEETQVFAYYIVKPVLLFHLNEFIEWCHTHNGHNRELLFKKTEGNIREYGELIERLYMLPEFIKTVETEQTNYSRFSSISKDNVKDTLRMSLFE